MSRIETLLAKMTLREKLGQLNMVASGYAVTGPLFGGDSPDAIRSGDIQLVINTASTPQSIADSFEIRRSALTHFVPHYTTVAGARAAVHAIAALKAGTLEVAPLQSYFRGSF